MKFKALKCLCICCQTFLLYYIYCISSYKDELTLMPTMLFDIECLSSPAHIKHVEKNKSTKYFNIVNLRKSNICFVWAATKTIRSDVIYILTAAWVALVYS